MKIVMVTPYWKDTVGGIRTYVRNLVLQLEKNHPARITVLTSDIPTGPNKLPRNKLVCLFKLPFMLKKLNPEIIHCHALEVMLLGSVLYAKFSAQKPSVLYTFHTQPSPTIEPPDKPGLALFMTNLSLLTKKQVFHWALRQCHLVTCVSQTLGEELINIIKLPIKGFAVTTPGVSKTFVNQCDIRKFKTHYGLLNSFPVLCTISVLNWKNKVKGVELLIEAFSEISDAFPNGKLLVVGDGDYRQRLQSLAKRLNLMDKVIFSGNMTNPFTALCASDVYCHISLQDALPISILEAMACSKPVVATKIGGIPEAIQSDYTGILVNPDVQSVTDGIMRVLRDPVFARQLGKNAALTAIERYSWEKIGAILFNFYTCLKKNSKKCLHQISRG